MCVCSLQELSMNAVVVFGYSATVLLRLFSCFLSFESFNTNDESCSSCVGNCCGGGGGNCCGSDSCVCGGPIMQVTIDSFFSSDSQIRLPRIISNSHLSLTLSLTLTHHQASSCCSHRPNPNPYPNR